MLWLTWRQHRAQLLMGSAVMAALLAFLLVTGFPIASAFRSSGLASCLAVPGRDCNAFQALFGSHNSLQFTVPLFLVVPALIGVFWGAPLVAREVEQGTHRLAWTQSVSRLRWAGTKIAVLVAATVAGVALIAFVLSWWSRPFVDSSDARFSLGIFDLRGVVPVAYALFALALGVAVGTRLRRTIPAMVATLGIFGAVRIGVEFWLRPHFAAPKTVNYGFFASNPRAGLGDWVLSTKTLDRAGHVLSNGQSLDFNVLSARCPGLPLPRVGFPNKDAVQACMQRLGLHIQATYQPGSRYVLFQGIETAIFVVMAAALLGLAVWWLRRRVV